MRKDGQIPPLPLAINRTIEELKFLRFDEDNVHGQSINRTIEELKLR